MRVFLWTRCALSCRGARCIVVESDGKFGRRDKKQFFKFIKSMEKNVMAIVLNVEENCTCIFVLIWLNEKEKKEIYIYYIYTIYIISYRSDRNLDSSFRLSIIVDRPLEIARVNHRPQNWYNRPGERPCNVPDIHPFYSTGYRHTHRNRGPWEGRMRGRVPPWDVLSNLLQVVETLSVVYLEQRGAADPG